MNKPTPHPHAPGSRLAKREANALKRQADETKRQAETIALRVSMALEWTVAVRFAGGAHDVRIVRTGGMPEGYSEARIAVRERHNLPALRYTHAERIAAILRESLARNADTSRRVVSPPLRRRA
jgi:hypothetical protein